MVERITNASAKALATSGPEGINVVPVSVVRVTPELITLYDFFMGKTVRNLVATPTVALACWSGLQGIQVRAIAVYITTGEDFDAAATEMRQQFPERILKGLIHLTPTAVFDVSADTVRIGQTLMVAD